MNSLSRVGIALGSNVGDRLQNLRGAVLELRKFHVASEHFILSRIYQSDPVDCPEGSEWFANAVIEMTVDSNPLALLKQLHALEAAAGRPPIHEKNAPRPLDLDILYWDDQTIDLPELQIPHPQITSRSFVLAPLSDVCPLRVLPGQTQSIASLAAALPPDAGCVVTNDRLVSFC